jgi:hypothetical protein
MELRARWYFKVSYRLREVLVFRETRIVEEDERNIRITRTRWQM